MTIYKQIENEIKKHDNIIIFHHIRPDGDCLGSQFGLLELLKTNFPDKNIYAVGDKKGSFPFLEMNHDEVPSDEILKSSLGIIVDANFLERIELSELHAKIPHWMRIDHHPNDDDLNSVCKWVDASYIAAAEQIAQLAFQLEWKVSPKAATYIYLGIHTDSGRFNYDNTSPRTLRLAAFLWENGAQKDLVNLNLNKKSLNSLKFNVDVWSNYKTKENVIYYVIDLAKQAQLGINHLQAARVNYLANFDGYDTWVFFIEEPDHRFRVEFRSNQRNVRNAAMQWNGGGHLKASGAMINSFSLIDQVVDSCVKLEII